MEVAAGKKKTSDAGGLPGRDVAGFVADKHAPPALDRPAVEQIEEGLETLLPVNNTRYLLLMAGVDHEEANQHLPEIVREANRRLQGVQLHIGSLPEYVEDVLG